MSEWTVPAISCGHCVKAVTEALRGEDPQAQVQIDLATKRVQVQSTVDDARLRQVLLEAGYEPIPA